MKSLKELLGLLTGVAAGVLVGVLFAPDRGSRTRKQIARKSEDYADALTDRLENLLDTVSEKYDNTRQKAEDFISDGRAKYDSAKRVVKNVKIS